MNGDVVLRQLAGVSDAQASGECPIDASDWRDRSPRSKGATETRVTTGRMFSGPGHEPYGNRPHSLFAAGCALAEHVPMSIRRGWRPWRVIEFWRHAIGTAGWVHSAHVHQNR